jgi:hypothetical protein
MYLSKSLLIFGLTVFLLPLKDKKNKTTVVFHDQPEILNGRVMWLIEIRSAINEPPPPCSIDTTSFYKNGNLIEMRSGTGDRTCGITKFITQFKNGSISEIRTADGDIFKYGKNGQIIKFISYSYPGLYDLYKYDTEGNLIEDIQHLGVKRIFQISKFKYNVKNILTEGYSYDDGIQLRSKAFYRYVSFDNKGNWTKRIVTHTNIKNVVESRDTIQRKIVYYK